LEKRARIVISLAFLAFTLREGIFSVEEFPVLFSTSWSDDLSESGECRGAKRSGDTPIGLLFRREIQPRRSERGNGGSARDAAGSGFPDPSPESPADA